MSIIEHIAMKTYGGVEELNSSLCRSDKLCTTSASPPGEEPLIPNGCRCKDQILLAERKNFSLLQEIESRLLGHPAPEYKQCRLKCLDFYLPYI
jgi:hypothetical protein